MARRKQGQERVIPVELVRLRYLTSTLGLHFNLLKQLRLMREQYRKELRGE